MLGHRVLLLLKVNSFKKGLLEEKKLFILSGQIHLLISARRKHGVFFFFFLKMTKHFTLDLLKHLTFPKQNL